MTQNGKYKFVMLVDDNDVDNFINEKIISSARFANEIYVNVSGKSALDYLMEIPASGPAPDVIFIDINMPIMDGFELLENLKKIGGDVLKDCKLVVLTSSVYAGDRERAKQISPDVLFFNKPLTEEKLAEV